MSIIAHIQPNRVTFFNHPRPRYGLRVSRRPDRSARSFSCLDGRQAADEYGSTSIPMEREKGEYSKD